MRWWGWGDPAHPPALPAHALELLRETVGRRRARRARRSRSARCDCRAARWPSDAAAALRGDRRRGARPRRSPRAGRCTPPARAIPISCACAPGDARGGARRGRAARRPRAGARACSSCARRASLAVVPFGGGTSVVGGVAPLRGEHARGDRAGHAPHGRASLELDRESRTVTVRRGHARAGARAAAGGARGSRSGTSRSPSSTSRWAAARRRARRGRPPAATGASSKMVLGLRLAAPAGDIDAAPRCPRAPPGRGCASCWSARRGRSG